MDANLEAAADAVTGAVVATAIDKPSAPQGSAPAGNVCRNCNAATSGKYCAVCGQPTKVHRSLLSLGHDILHGVFHLEGRIWHTIPELFFKPGRLTRRYIDGERAKFVAPLPLFLFSVFFMFAVFSFTSTGSFDNGKKVAGVALEEWKQGNAKAIDATNRQVEELRAQLAAADVTPEKRAELESRITGLEASREVMEALTTADWKRFSKQLEKDKDDIDDLKIDVGTDAASEIAGSTSKWAAFREAQENPGLLLYKVKTNSYKFSWALIPISLPFMWLLFCWRRDIHLYDHAVFITYSLCFMMMFLVLLNIAATLGVPGSIWLSTFCIVAPLHVYKQMRQAYAVSRGGAGVRLALLTVFITVILTLFTSMLFVLGVIA